MKKVRAVSLYNEQEKGSSIGLSMSKMLLQFANSDPY